MDGVKKQREQSFEPIVFESVIDTIAGGGTIDTTGYTNADNLILAGLPVSPKDPDTGLHKIVKPADVATSPILGYVHKTVTISSNSLVSIVISGTLRTAMLQSGYTAATLSAKTPKVVFV